MMINDEGIVFEDELEVVFSLMNDDELMSMKERLEMMVKERAYQAQGFPISEAGINFVKAIVMFMYWMRRGKGVKIERGEVVLCELGESPFVKKYKKREVEVLPENEGVVEEKEGGEWI